MKDEEDMIGGPGKRWNIVQGQYKSWSDEPFAGYGFSWVTHTERGLDCEASYGYSRGVLFADQNCGNPISQTVQLNKLENMEQCMSVSGNKKAQSILLMCEDPL